MDSIMVRSGRVGVCEALGVDASTKYEGIIAEIKNLKESPWTSVEDDKPAPNDLVSIVLNGDKDLIAVGSFAESEHGNSWRIGNQYIAWDFDFSFGIEMEVTHWMPLPAPPIK